MIIGDHYSLTGVKLIALYKQLATETIVQKFKKAESFPITIKPEPFTTNRSRQN